MDMTDVPPSGAEPSTEGLVTWDEFVALDEDDPRELCDGRLVEFEVPNLRHEAAVIVLSEHLGPWARAHGAVALASGYKVRISRLRGAMPDLQIIPKEAVRPENDVGLVRGVPILAIEILSPTRHRYDRVTKLEWYASIGVREYWIVDPEARTIERLVLENGRYVIAQTATDGVFEPEGWDGLAIPLDELFLDPTE
jgi:Uma2 family endonuclease